jgi:hypothetical protein
MEYQPLVNGKVHKSHDRGCGELGDCDRQGETLLEDRKENEICYPGEQAGQKITSDGLLVGTRIGEGQSPLEKIIGGSAKQASYSGC